MAKRDFFYDTKGGRIYLGAMAVLLLVMGLVLLVLSILIKIRGADFFWQTLVMGVGSIVTGVCQLIVLKRRKQQAPKGTDTTVEAASETKPETESEPTPVTEQVAEPEPTPATETEPSAVPLAGEPDDVVVLDPTRINEPDGAVLVYRKEGVLVFDGKQIPIGKIVDGCVSNSNNNPYLPVAYHILLGMDDKNIVHIPVGQDFEWAQEALKQLQATIAPQE